MQLSFKGENVGRQIRLSTDKSSRKIQKASKETAEEVRDQVLALGRANIQSAGRFGSRWTKGFKGKLVRASNEWNIAFTHDVPYFDVFQYGKTIRGKPLLWIPLSFATDAQGVYARNYRYGLFRVDRKNGKAPLLLSVRDGEPKYHGQTSVKIPKKFRIIEIIRDVSKKMRKIFAEKMRG